MAGEWDWLRFMSVRRIGWDRKVSCIKETRMKMEYWLRNLK
jgi:hypothetical protein